ncbi:hypothetical protein PBY51_011099 [Eleginops maclovinus]|uniref:Uncharacterized protein n=1 Tax=Eleginops maclovinus TaxID=56733 RepID=A0AAN7XBH5_ELEMC|nr:hypothetical protein PBY51_011099 [Eleginops maclovinus]
MREYHSPLPPRHVLQTSKTTAPLLTDWSQDDTWWLDSPSETSRQVQESFAALGCVMPRAEINRLCGLEQVVAAVNV